MFFGGSFWFDNHKYNIAFRYIIPKLIDNQNTRVQITEFDSFARCI